MLLLMHATGNADVDAIGVVQSRRLSYTHTCACSGARPAPESCELNSCKVLPLMLVLVVMLFLLLV